MNKAWKTALGVLVVVFYAFGLLEHPAPIFLR